MMLLMFNPRFVVRIALPIFVCVPLPVVACTSCFSGVDELAANGVRLAVFFLLGLTVLLLAGFASFFLYLRHRARRAATEQGYPDPEHTYLVVSNSNDERMQSYDELGIPTRLKDRENQYVWKSRL